MLLKFVTLDRWCQLEWYDETIFNPALIKHILSIKYIWGNRLIKVPYLSFCFVFFLHTLQVNFLIFISRNSKFNSTSLRLLLTNKCQYWVVCAGHELACRLTWLVSFASCTNYACYWYCSYWCESYISDRWMSYVHCFIYIQKNPSAPVICCVLFIGNRGIVADLSIL